MFIVAITGGIATGKSTVSKVFARNGIPIVDADQIAREIVQPGKPCWEQIRTVFGDEVLLPSKEINRVALGRLIFANPELRAKLNRITHPVIHRTIFVQVVKHFMSGRAWIVLDLPLLFETGHLLDFIYKIICVTCDPETQLSRLMARGELSAEDAKRRIECQMPLDKKCELSNFVIDNSGCLEDTERNAQKICNYLKDSKQHWRNRFIMLTLSGALILALYYLSRLFNVVPNLANAVGWWW